MERLAIGKALTVGRRLVDTGAGSPADLLVVGADTIVALDEVILGKPTDTEEAHAMLLRLRALPHHVHTALAVVRYVGGSCHHKRSLVNSTTVHMRNYSDAEIAAYVASGDPQDKAGAYAIQHQQFRPVESLSGCPAGRDGDAGRRPAAPVDRVRLSHRTLPSTFLRVSDRIPMLSEEQRVNRSSLKLNCRD